ncbi:uncharacterized protein LOC142973637 [Anticarsia gemmatalis]|uniref:uncharacterized protein LOC142973637 n=1 Tax=Anticarsia gemmatalis TaxID=129554 RepID=UPI003F7734EF
MELLLFLVVFAIAVNNGKARSLIDNDLDILTKNGLEGRVSESDFKNGNMFVVPTVITNGAKITINGTLNPKDKTFTAILRNKMMTKRDCIIKYTFKSNTITVTPGVQDYDEAYYEHNLHNAKTQHFSLTLIARVDSNGQEMLALTFQVNEEGMSDQLICDIDNFENIKYIEMKEGVSQMDSLLFRFRE